MAIYEHKFNDGSVIRLLYKEFKDAKKEVPTLQFGFLHNNHNSIIEVPLYDRNAGKYLLPEIIEAAKTLDEGEIEETPQVIRLNIEKENPIETQKFTTKVCIDCGKEFIPTCPAQKHCKLCMMGPEKVAELQAKLEKEADDLESDEVIEVKPDEAACEAAKEIKNG